MEIVHTTKKAVEAAGIAISVIQEALELYGETMEKKCVIFDIDETLLKNGDDDQFTIQPCGEKIFNFCKWRGIQIILLTARRKSDDSMRYAKEQLRALGYDVSDCLLHMTNKEHDDDDDDFAGNFKKHIRDSICENYTVLCNAGDRWSDVLDENYGKKYDRSLYYAIKPPQDKIVFALKFPEND